MMDESPVLNLLGVKVHQITINDLLKLIVNLVEKNQKQIISNVNVHAINLAYRIDWFRQFLNQAQVNFCDGYGVVLGAKILGHSIPQRITYAEAMWDFAKLCAENGYSLFLLGAKPGVAQKAAQNLLVKFPNLKICGVQHGYFNKNKDHPENQDVIQKINSVHPDLLVVGFGMPLQEKWLMENWDELDVLLAMTGGAVFDFISGATPRAPRWMTDHGLEWLGRLIIEPRRLWRRYLLGNPIFLWRVLLQRLGLIKC